MSIKRILDTIAAISGKNDKGKELAKHKDNELLKRVIYLAHSPRVKFYIKQIPEYNTQLFGGNRGLEWALDNLSVISNRTITGGKSIEHLNSILEAINPADAIVIERIIGKDCFVSIVFMFTFL